MDFGAIVFFGFLAAVIIVPQILRNQERQRVHDTIRATLAKGQAVPPELFAALRSRRRVYTTDYDLYPAAAYAAPPPPPAGATVAGDPLAPETAAPIPTAAPVPPPVYLGPTVRERDLRRGLTWLAIGLGLIGAGAAFYAGLYYDGGAPEVFSSFAALGAIPLFVGVTYLALWFFSRKSAA